MDSLFSLLQGQSSPAQPPAPSGTSGAGPQLDPQKAQQFQNGMNNQQSTLTKLFQLLSSGK